MICVDFNCKTRFCHKCLYVITKVTLLVCRYIKIFLYELLSYPLVTNTFKDYEVFYQNNHNCSKLKQVINRLF